MNRKTILVAGLSVFIFLCFELQTASAQSTPKRGGMVTVGISADIVNE